MTVFSNYAQYYDLLYKDKDYLSETRYLHQLVQSCLPGADSILELGCGTGAYTVMLAEMGYAVHGVDLSSEMLVHAENRMGAVRPELASRLQFSRGDIRKIRIEKTFDAVISTFHVMSYLTANEDLRAVFVTAKAHLKPGGIFVFDCWYGPAVLSTGPAVRVKRMENEEIRVTRIADPVVHPNENYVDVKYELFIKHKDNSTIEEVREHHRMRYFFVPEIRELFAGAELEMIAAYGWMTHQEPGLDTWSVCFLGKRL